MAVPHDTIAALVLLEDVTKEQFSRSEFSRTELMFWPKMMKLIKQRESRNPLSSSRSSLTLSVGRDASWPEVRLDFNMIRVRMVKLIN